MRFDQSLSDLLYSKTNWSNRWKTNNHFIATAVNISRVTVNCFLFYVIVFAMLPAHSKDFKILRPLTTDYRWTRVPQVWSIGSSTGLMARKYEVKLPDYRLRATVKAAVLALTSKIEPRKSEINSSTFGFTRTPYYMISKARRSCKLLKSAPFPPAERDEFRGSSKFRQNISLNRISRPKANPKCVLAKVLRQYIK